MNCRTVGCRTVIRGVVAGATLTTGGMTVGGAVDTRLEGVDMVMEVGGGAGGGALAVVRVGGGTFNVGGGPPACAVLHCTNSFFIVSIRFRAKDLAALIASGRAWCNAKCRGSNLSPFSTATTPVSERMYSKFVPFWN